MIKRKGVILSDAKMLINGMGRFELLGKHLSGINTRKRTGLFIITCPKLSILLTMTFMNYRGCHFQCYHSLNHCCSFQLLNQQCQCTGACRLLLSLRSNSYLEDSGDSSTFVSAFYSKPQRHHRHISIILYRRALVS